MKTKRYYSLVTMVFSIIGLAHLLRAFTDTTVMVGSAQVPVWVSWFGVLLAGCLAYQSYKLRG